MANPMSDDLERLNRVLDDLAAERDPRDRACLSSDEAELAEMAALLKAARDEPATPDADFVETLAARIAATSAAGDGAAPGADEQSGVSRRGLIGRIAVAAVGVVAGGGAGAVLRGETDNAAAASAYRDGHAAGYEQGVTEPLAAPMVPNDRGSWHSTGHNVAALAPGRALRFRAGAVEGFLVNPGGHRKIYALSAACTHMGCMISWLDSTRTFLCPCHGAQYNADGSRLSGIQRHPLPKLETWIDKHGEVFVWSVDQYPPITKPATYQRP